MIFFLLKKTIFNVFSSSAKDSIFASVLLLYCAYDWGKFNGDFCGKWIGSVWLGVLI